jgi:hypothetical protein
MKKIYLMPLLILLFGCGTSRTYDYPYETVAKVLKDKFVVNHNAFQTTKPEVYEKGKKLDISFQAELDYYFSIGTDIALDSKTPKSSVVSVIIIEYYKSWSYDSRSLKMEKEFLDILGKRLETGKWEKLPWEKPKEINKDIIPAIIEDIKEKHE